MTEWTSGYVADIDYTYGYYAELNPARCHMALLNASIKPPEFQSACELGFGQGVSVNLHAAASDIKWFGTDFNPAQAAFARDLAEISGSGAALYDDAFAEFAKRPDLPDFDYISLHGIWSWISDENRDVIVDFIRRKLKVGGVLYVSYNTMPGWASFAPLRNLMSQHADLIGSEGSGIVSRIDGALEFAKSLLDTNPLFKRANPQVEDRLNKMSGMSRHYLAHEYFNKDWCPMHFATLAAWLRPAKLDFAAPAHPADHFNNINLSTEQNDFLQSIPDRMLRQSTRDFMVNQQFRRDYWIKGARRCTALERMEALSKMEVVLSVPREDIKFSIQGGQGEARLNESIYVPILDALADYKPKTIAKLLKAAQGANEDINFQSVVEAVMLLSSSQSVAPVRLGGSSKKVKQQTDKLNQHLISQARSRADVVNLVSPVTGGGIPIGRIQQLFLGSVNDGAKTPTEIAARTWAHLSLLGERMLKDGKAIESDADNLADLEIRAQEFIEKLMPILKALQIAN
ncbi:MAG: class I SAM-dependent methyltransferase [Pseudohongiellaceae bacterium]